MAFPLLAAPALSLLQCVDKILGGLYGPLTNSWRAASTARTLMEDWKQITARIRRARGSRDPAGQLLLLYEKTNDAMVAFELGRHFEIAKDSAQALQWYLTSANKFRRGDWKTKAREAVVRMGGELPPASDPVPELSAAEAEGGTASPAIIFPEPAVPFEQTATAFESLVAAGAEGMPAPESLDGANSDADKKHRRRGRRGGRNRRKAGSPPVSGESRSTGRLGARARAAETPPEPEPDEILPPRVIDSRAIPRIPVEQVPESGAPGVKGRFGDPGLASRLSLLEMQLRRLLTCPAVKLDEAAHAPAGPGVFVLTDDDMTTYYYVEACDTLRIAIASLARSGMSRRGNTNLKALLGDHLGIPETRVTKYLSEHCVVRWLQLDEGALNFCHFAIAVLRPNLNE
jgi:hypothetical protein